VASADPAASPRCTPLFGSNWHQPGNPAEAQQPPLEGFIFLQREMAVAEVGKAHQGNSLPPNSRELARRQALPHLPQPRSEEEGCYKRHVGKEKHNLCLHTPGP